MKLQRTILHLRSGEKPIVYIDIAGSSDAEESSIAAADHRSDGDIATVETGEFYSDEDQ